MEQKNIIQISLISVIVPVYNVEQYLEDCLKSIQQQTYQNIEVILVNDGSTDSSRDICERFCTLDTRFRLIDQTNQGLSGARNTGIDHSTGEYICFVDSDDCIHERYIEILYELICKYQVKMAICEYVKTDQYNTFLEETRKVQCCDCEVDRITLLKRLSTTGEQNIAEPVVVSWNKLIKREVFDDLRFRVGKIHEDEFMIIEYLKRIDKVAWTTAQLYFYRQRQSSIMCNKKDLRHVHILEADIERVEAFRGIEYQEVYPDLVRSYFANVKIFYYMLNDGENTRELVDLIIPGYRKMVRLQLGVLPLWEAHKHFKYLHFLKNVDKWHYKLWKKSKKKIKTILRKNKT